MDDSRIIRGIRQLRRFIRQDIAKDGHEFLNDFLDENQGIEDEIQLAITIEVYFVYLARVKSHCT